MSAWRKWPLSAAQWSRLVEWSPEAMRQSPVVRRDDEPFVDATRAWARVLKSGHSASELAERMNEEGRAALAGTCAGPGSWQGGEAWEVKALFEG